MFTSFEFSNFQPSARLKNYSAHLVNDLARHSPKSLSCLGEMRVAKDGDKTKYICNLELLSGLGVFFEESAASEPAEAIDSAIHNLQRRLGDWITRRRIAYV